MAMDEVSYVNALLWHMERPRGETRELNDPGYSPLATQVFMRIATVFPDPWTARIWFEFSRIDPSSELTPILACHSGMADLIDDALVKYVDAPLPIPGDSHDQAAMGDWLACGGTASKHSRRPL